jgi:threonine/homoserine/homoserine lactone efflux protein
MPETATLLTFALATIALVLIPGPNLVYIVTRSSADGRRAGLASALGVEAGTLVHLTAAAAGASALIASSATALTALRYTGAAYLVYLGIKTLRATPDHQTPTRAPASARRAFAQGVVVNVLNPKVALFFLAFLPQFTDPALGALGAQTLILGVIFFAIALAMDLIYVLAASAVGARIPWGAGAARRRERLTGAIYLALGVLAAVAGGR